ncbi:MAG TPA: PQQ-binding-like beta-propeller repeat protein [Gemmataceae bacterium]|nr:PQQ-binding-like beta-propeller repeat protein [Gemmataceae bacterium]
MKTRTLLAGCCLFLFVLTMGIVQTLAAKAPAPPKKSGHDWPQWRGPNRDNVSTETGLLKTWPEGGPKLLWTSEDAGLGYSGPAIVGDRLYTLGSDEKNDFVIAIDTRKGTKLWSKPIAPFVRNNWGGGPRGTPAVDGDCVYAISAAGKLVCLKTADGEQVWSVSLPGKDGLGGNKPNWNYSESPLVDGEQVVCSPGGSKGTLAALDKKTGNVLWRSKELTDPAGYSSIVPTTVGGVRQYVQLTMKGVAGVAAKDGRLLWYYPNKKYRTAVIPSPIVHNDHVYAVAGYGAGAVLLKLTPSGEGTKEEQVYDENAMRLMDNKHGGVVRVGDYVYGASDRGGWTCQEFKTGKKMWQSSKLRKGSLTYADGNLYCYSEDKGTVVLVPASPEGWQEKGRFSIPRQSAKRSRSGGVWTHPVIADGKLYLRDQELLFCYDVKDSGR